MLARARLNGLAGRVVARGPPVAHTWFKGNTRKFYEAAMFSTTYKIIPKRIVYYSIGSHSTQLVLL